MAPGLLSRQGRQDSNLEPPVLETGALPVELRPSARRHCTGVRRSPSERSSPSSRSVSCSSALMPPMRAVLPGWSRPLRSSSAGLDGRARIQGAEVGKPPISRESRTSFYPLHGRAARRHPSSLAWSTSAPAIRCARPPDPHLRAAGQVRRGAAGSGSPAHVDEGDLVSYSG